MGNYRFRVSDMIPNAWFYKLKDMSTKKINKTHPTTTTKKASEKKPSCPSPPPPRHTYYYFTPEHPSPGDRSFSRKAIVTQFTEPPRKSAKKKRRPPKLSSSSSSTSSSKLVSASVSAGCSYRATFDSVWKPDALPELPPASPPSPPSPPAVAAEEHLDNVHSWSSSCSCRVTSSSTSTDIVADGGSVERKTEKLDDGSDSVPSSNSKKSFWSEFNGRLDSVLMDEYDNGFNSVAEVELPPIMTKPAKFNDLTLGLKRREEPTSRFSRSAEIEEKVLNSYQNSHVSRGSLSHVKVVRDQEKSSSPARKSTSSRGLRIRVNSPRLASKKIQAYTRRSLPEAAARRKSVSESFAVVKSSFDPQRDFRDSMVEMIVENNLRASKDLEDLLACYLSLNSNEYHDVIVKVFEQIWFDLTDIRL